LEIYCSWLSRVWLYNPLNYPPSSLVLQIHQIESKKLAPKPFRASIAVALQIPADLSLLLFFQLHRNILFQFVSTDLPPQLLHKIAPTRLFTISPLTIQD
jgi:hypothetical protein